MKKRITALLFALLTALTGITALASDAPQREPDTDVHTETRVLGDNQAVEYRFHMKRISSVNKKYLYLHLFDQDAEAHNKADNWTSTLIGDTEGKRVLSAEHSAKSPEGTRWDTTNTLASSHWTMLLPYSNFYDVTEADLALTIRRKGERVKLTLEIDGGRAWEAQQSVGNMDNGELYLYIRPGNLQLSDIEYRELGEAGLLLPGWLRLLAIAGMLAAAFGLHRLAKKGEWEVYVADGIFPPTTGILVCGAALPLLLLGRTRPDLLTNLTLGYISLPLSPGGPGFWVPLVTAAVGLVGFAAYLLSKARGDNENPLVYLLCAPLFGLGHLIWIAAIAFMVILLLGEILKLFVGIAFVVVLMIFAAGMGTSNKKYKEVVTTTHVYNDVGNLVDFKYDISYKEDDKH